jgi:uncharacterized membrane-anchored protein YitT (DUF2179 family)
MKQSSTPHGLETNRRKVVTDYVLLTFGAAILAVNFDLFLAPFNIAPGGVMGLAIIINKFTGWLPGLTMFILTIPLLIVGFHYMGRFRFLIRSFYVTALYSLGVDLFAPFLPAAGVTQDLLLNALYGGIIGGMGIGLIYRGGTSPAGSSVISRILNLKTGLPNSQAYLFIDGGIILLAGAVFGWEMAMYAFVTLFTWGVVTDYILEGPSVVRTAFIVTDAPEEVCEVLLHRMGVGVTGWNATGMFSKTDHETLFCTVSRADIKVLKSLVIAADPKAFIVIGQGHQASGGTLRHALPKAEPKPIKPRVPAKES